jgi:hypothetical protein
MLMLLREQYHRRPTRRAVRPRVDIAHELLAGVLQRLPVRIAVAEVVIGRTRSAFAIFTVASEPPLLCGSAGSHVAIVSP